VSEGRYTLVFRTKVLNTRYNLGAETNEFSGPKTDLAIEIYQNLQRFPHCLLLTRVGQFYEVSIMLESIPGTNVHSPIFIKQARFQSC
jgi:hypothetical protein